MEQSEIYHREASLVQLYQQFHDQIRPLIGLKHSNPLYVKVPTQYWREQIRICFVGQQTASWFDSEVQSWTLPPNLAVAKLQDIYDRFDFGRGRDTAGNKIKRYRSPFWSMSHAIRNKLNCVTVVWTNIDRVDYGGGRLIKNPEIKLASEELLLEELKLLSPHLLVFWVGPTYPIPASIAGNRQPNISGTSYITSFVPLIDDNSLAFVSYHPNFIYRRLGKQVKLRIEQTIVDAGVTMFREPQNA